MNAFTIKDLENLSGIKAHTIRIWEQRYSFLKPQRTPTNIRYYSNEELKAVLNIALLNKYGFKISHICRMQQEEICNRILSLADPVAVQERIISGLIQEMVDLDMEGFERTIEGYIAARGIDRTLHQIIFPFLERIGILWQTGHIIPAQEHLVSNIIRQKLIGAIEKVVSHVQREKTFLLFLPEGEHHELGLLYMQYVLKSRGIKVLYLGANVPVDDAVWIVNMKKPDVIFVHFTTTAAGFNFDKFLQQAEAKLSDSLLVITGHLTLRYNKKIPPNIHFKHSLSEVMEFISSLSH